MSRCIVRQMTLVMVAAVVTAGMHVAWPSDGEARNVKNTTRTNVNHNVNHNRNVNVNSNRNVNVNRDIDVDVDRGWGVGRAVATTAAITATAAVTSAVVGSMVHTLPPACSSMIVGGIAYQQCGGVWYQPQYVGTQVSYVVVNAPR